ncbi:MAG TPA: hypothetical protein VK162_02375 [Streptosporangiaceae bacterium]|nr:hypothetical protein [Streptosporangiaceae bacterium]
MNLDPLEPQLIGRLFGRGSPRGESPHVMKAITPKVGFLAIGFVCLAAILVVAISQDALTAHAAPSALPVIFNAPKRVSSVEMPLSQDPVAIVFILVALLTPIFCAEQVEAIQGVVGMSKENYLARPPELRGQEVPVSDLNNRVETANKAFRLVGNWPLSVLFLTFSALISYIIYARLLANGLLQSWNATAIPSDIWGRMVYAGWWANYQHHRFLAIALWALGTYLFYFLLKQLLLGAVFAWYATFARRKHFGIIPNMEYNSDGYWGLRLLRRFMQWTFASTIAHVITTLGVFIVWLRFSQLTVALAAGVMLASSLVVFHPSLLAYRSVQDSKVRYLKEIAACDKLKPEEKEKYYGRIWTNSNLPFRTRSTVTAVTVYVLLPLMLAFVSSLITRK